MLRNRIRSRFIHRYGKTNKLIADVLSSIIFFIPDPTARFLQGNDRDVCTDACLVTT
jgi:hypothetical protein